MHVYDAWVWWVHGAWVWWVHGAWVWWVHGACVWCMLVVNVCVERVSCVCMMQVYDACVWCMGMMHGYGAWVWCMGMMHVYDACVWIIAMLYEWYSGIARAPRVTCVASVASVARIARIARIARVARVARVARLVCVARVSRVAHIAHVAHIARVARVACVARVARVALVARVLIFNIVYNIYLRAVDWYLQSLNTFLSCVLNNSDMIFVYYTCKSMSHKPYYWFNFVFIKYIFNWPMKSKYEDVKNSYIIFWNTPSWQSRKKIKPMCIFLMSSVIVHKDFRNDFHKDVSSIV